MADIYLVRHGSNDYLGKALAGRLPSVHLNEQGRAEAERLAAALADKGIQRIFSSPLERSRQTAEPLARRTGLAVEISEEIHEVDFGDWAGKTMKELETLPAWKLFNIYRSGAPIPNGETMLNIQSRMVAFLEKLRRDPSHRTFALFSHGDPIRAALAFCLGMPLDLLTRLEISPGSYTLLRLEDWGPQLLAMNVTP